MHKHLIVIVGSLLVSLITASPATAATIIGGSNLLSQADADQLQSWLGEGNIAITNIFSHAPGDGKTSVNFHAAADGQGRTFSIIEVLAGNFYELTANGDSYVTISRQVIGGYNPQSWASVGGYNVTPLDAARTAFLFNLTNDLQQEQNLSGQGLAGSGQYQTVNAMSAGPTFGAGYDLVVYDNFATGSARNYSYGGASNTQNIIESPTAASNSHNTFAIGRIEVFTISAAAAEEVPEPASLALWSLASLAGFAAWRRRKQSAVSTAA